MFGPFFVVVFFFFQFAVFAYRLDDTLRVMFTGNSITAPATGPWRGGEFASFAAAKGTKFKQGHVHKTWTPDGNIIKDTVAMQDIAHWLPWDYVVAQDGSSASDNIPAFYQYGGQLVDSIVSGGSIPVLFMHHRNSAPAPIYDSILGKWPQTQQDVINKIYLDLAATKHCYVAPVGFAWNELIRYHPEYQLYLDGIHTTLAGGYLESAVIFSAVTGISPVGLPNLHALDSGVLHTLQCEAWKACLQDTLVPFIVPWPRPKRPDYVFFNKSPDTMECYSRKSYSLLSHFSGDSVGGPISEAVFHPITPGLATIDPFGVVTTLRQGTARFTGEYYGRKDTLLVTIVQDRGILDSIRILPNNSDFIVLNGFRFHATAFFHNSDGYVYQKNADTLADWFCDTSKILISNGAVLRKNAASDSLTLIAKLENCSDTVRFFLGQELDLLWRINFQANRTPINSDWMAADTSRFSDSVGFGWMNTTGLLPRDNRLGDNILFRTLVLAQKPQVFKLFVPDADYIIKIGVGDNLYGDVPCYVAFGSDTLISLGNIKTNMTKTDTIVLRGSVGLNLTIQGAIDYLVLIKRQGVDINQVAYDNNPAVFSVTESPNDGCLFRADASPLIVTPNPFNSTTTIRLPEPLSKDGRLAVYDLQGKCVADLSRFASKRSLIWNSTGFSSGVYLLKADVPGRVITKKLLLLQ